MSIILNPDKIVLDEIKFYRKTGIKPIKKRLSKDEKFDFICNTIHVSFGLGYSATFSRMTKKFTLFKNGKFQGFIDNADLKEQIGIMCDDINRIEKNKRDENNTND